MLADFWDRQNNFAQRNNGFGKSHQSLEEFFRERSEFQREHERNKARLADGSTPALGGLGYGKY